VTVPDVNALILLVKQQEEHWLLRTPALVVIKDLSVRDRLAPIRFINERQLGANKIYQ